MPKASDAKTITLSLLSLERMERAKQKFAVLGGYTLSDLQQEVRDQAAKLPTLIAPVPGSEGYCFGPWVADLIAPADESGDWKAVICGADRCLYCIAFTIKDRAVTLKGEPMKVERTTEYEYVDQMEERAAQSPKFNYRYFQVRTEDVNVKSGEIQVAFSSETPGVQVANRYTAKITGLKRGTEFVEILSHDKDDVDLSSLNNSGGFLDEHVKHLQLGKVKRASLSKDKKCRAILLADKITELSKTRFEQMRTKSRPHVSVGYVLTGLLRKEKQGDQTAYVFSWAPYEISSVMCPMDGTVGAYRSMIDGDDEEFAHCLECGNDFERSDLDDEYRCGECRDKPVEQTRSLNPKVDCPEKESKSMTEITEVQVVERETRARTEATTSTRKATAESLGKRNKDICDVAKEYKTKFGNYSRGKMAETIDGLQAEFIAKADGADTEVIRDFKFRCMEEVQKGEMPRPYSLRAKLRSQSGDVSDDDSLPPDYSRYNLGRAIRSIVERTQPGEKTGALVDGFEKEIFDDMQTEWKRNGLSQSSQLSGGFHVPWDAPARGFRPKNKRDMQMCARYQRDLSTFDFASGGALVPSMPILPTIELLRNRMVLGWAGTKSIAGLSGNIWIPRQTSAVAPQAAAENQALQATQQTFDQIEGRPRRVGNTQVYSRLLMLQSAPDIEALVRDDNFKEIAIKIDYLGINGSGAGNEPLGTMNTPGVGVIIFGGTATLGEIISFETTIRQQNIYDPIVYISTSSSRGRLMYVPAQLLGSTVVSGQTNAIWVTNMGEETIIGRPAYDSQQIPNNQMLAGAFEHQLHLQWGGLQVIVNPYTFARNDEIEITYNTYNDFALRHPQAFCVSADAANQ